MSRVNELKVQEIAKRSEKPWPKGCADSMFLEDSEELDVYDTSDNTMVSENGLHLTTSRLRLTDKVAASCALMTAVRLNVIEKKIERQLLVICYCVALIVYPSRFQWHSVLVSFFSGSWIGYV
eukprot:GHVQ01014417.1.p2 GENE.GHVQ01014417.1~~GHVQ01014417.1.p2  ORF type:complete len:123 (+),score=8.64 GHVQ01014417.1:377-745(+)